MTIPALGPGPDSDTVTFHSDDETPVTPPATSLRSEPGRVSPQSVTIPALGPGPDVDTVTFHSDDDAPAARRGRGAESESAALLRAMAKPKVFEGPEVDLQASIVDKLEKAIPKLDKDKATAKAAAEGERQFKGWQDAYRGEHGNAQTDDYLLEYTKRSGRVPPTSFDADNLYIGSIVLNDIPASSDGDAAMIKRAQLVETDQSLGLGTNAVVLPKKAKVEKDVVKNTLRTMIAAGQIEYLRKAGFVGKGWQVLIEVHYYRRRNKDQANLHKDTLGQTLFVNLNYANSKPMPGPEWLENPPTYEAHERFIQHALPGRFTQDLDTLRDAPRGATIETADLMPNAVVSFVDEAVHHATPLLGHRPAPVSALKEFLAADADYAATHQEATDAYKQAAAASGPPGTTASAFAAAFKSRLTEAEITRWRRLLDLCERGVGEELRRPELVRAGMTNPQVDRLLTYAYNPGAADKEKRYDKHHAVGIPQRARDKAVGRGPDRLPIGMDASKRPMPLPRRMSERGMRGDLPKDPGGDRRFFRTWVRAVRTGPPLESKSTESKRAMPTPAPRDGGSSVEPGVRPKLTTQAQPPAAASSSKRS